MSERLSHRDLAGVLAGVRELHGFEAGTNLPRRMIKITRELVPCEAVTYGKLTDDGSAETRQYRFLQQPVMEKFDTHLPALVANIHEHPLFSPLMEQSERAHKISDFVAPRQFSKSRLYREFYRHLGLRHQMIGVLPRLPEARVFLMLNRCGRDFSERDRLVMDHLLPHFRHAQNHAWAQAHIQHRGPGLKTGLSPVEPELIDLTPALAIRQITPRANGWLHKYFPGGGKGDGLPETLARWIKCHSWNHTPGEEALHPPHSMVVKTAAGHLDVTCLHHPDDSAQLMLKEMPATPAASPLPPGVHLTLREQEVYHWMCEGKTYPETAVILGMKPRTVHKHVERIFRKLGVENRLQAERLGWEG